MIRKVGGQYQVWNKDGTKPLSKLMSKEAADKRLRKIEFFKHKERKGPGPGPGRKAPGR